MTLVGACGNGDSVPNSSGLVPNLFPTFCARQRANRNEHIVWWAILTFFASASFCPVITVTYSDEGRHNAGDYPGLWRNLLQVWQGAMQRAGLDRGTRGSSVPVA